MLHIQAPEPLALASACLSHRQTVSPSNPMHSRLWSMASGATRRCQRRRCRRRWVSRRGLLRRATPWITPTATWKSCGSMARQSRWGTAAWRLGWPGLEGCGIWGQPPRRQWHAPGVGCGGGSPAFWIRDQQPALLSFPPQITHNTQIPRAGNGGRGHCLVLQPVWRALFLRQSHHRHRGRRPPSPGGCRWRCALMQAV